MAVTRTDDVVVMTANADVYPATTTTERPNSTVCSIKLVGAAAGKFYNLRRTASDGGILWSHLAGATAAEVPSEPVRFNVGPGLYLETDNTSNPAFKLILDLC